MVEQPIKLRKYTLLQLFARNIKLLLILLIYGSGLDLLIFRTYMEDKICFFIFEERDEHGKKECLDINGFGAFRPTNVLKSSGISVHHLNN